MVAVFNTRAARAGRNAKFVIVFAAAALVLVALLASWINRYTARHTEIDPCGGYAGRPSWDYIQRTGDRDAAEAYCLTHAPTISISIKNKHFISLQKKRLEALEQGILVTSDADYVPAIIRFKGDDYKARIRLKGDWTDHVHQPTRWSFRVVMSGGRDIIGRKRFSIQTFKARDFDKDPLYALHLARIGLMTPRYKPVQVKVNGEDWGTMVMEDHFNRELMEAYGRKESVIGRFDEADMWIHRFRTPEFDPYDNTYTTTYRSFNRRVIRKSAALQSYDRYSRSVMTAWQEGRLRLADIIDQEKFADFIIASEPWSGFHTFRWHNMRFYLNPYTMKFEPIPFDNGWGLWDIATPPVEAKVSGSQVLGELLDSTEFRQVLAQRIQPVITGLEEQDTWSELGENAAYLTSLLQAEGAAPRVNLDRLRNNLDFLAATGPGYFDKTVAAVVIPELDKQRDFHTQVKVSAYTNGVISLANKLPFAIRVTDVRLATDYSSHSIFNNDDETIELLPTPLRERPQILQLRVAAIEPGTRLVVTSENPAAGGLIKDSTEELLDFIDSANLGSWSPMALAGTAIIPDFIVVSGNHWLVSKGRWDLESTLVVPEGVALTIQAGATITVKKGGSILCRGVLDLAGTTEDPVVLQGDDGKFWNGIYLLDVRGPSTWKNVLISDVGSFTSDRFELSGALNFYRSDVLMKQVTIANIDAEDAINVVQSEFEFEQLVVRQTRSDALDSDFSTGVISVSEFVDVGGDAVDTSGSNVTINNITIDTVADKAISVGEASYLQVYDAHINDVGVAIAVKDYSYARFENINVRGARVAAVMAYSKKPEYGGAFLELVHFRAEEVENRVINQLGSIVLLEGKAIPPQKVNVDYYYQQGLMPK